MENLPTEMLLYIFEMLSYRDLKQRTDSSKTEATLILCGSSGERANIKGYDNMVILSLKCLNKIAFSLFEKVNDALTVSVNIGPKRGLLWLIQVGEVVG